MTHCCEPEPTDKLTWLDKHGVYLDHENKITGSKTGGCKERTADGALCVCVAALSDGQTEFKWYELIFLDSES